MRNFIKVNYNLYPSKIYNKNNNYFFFSGNDKILIIKTNKSPKELDKFVRISNELYNNKIDVSTFLINTNGEYYTKKDNNYIILLKCNSSNNNISLEEILKYNSNIHNDLEELNTINIWESKIDTIEKEMSEYKNEFPIIQESLNYFIGISENGIQLLKSIKYDNNSIGHNISLDNFNIYEINNPINLVKTNKMHDISLYIKYNFYNDYVDYEKLYNNIKKANKEDLIYFYSSMLYQNEYFDDVKNVLLNKKNENVLLKYIDNIKKYKDLLKYLKDTLHNIKEISEIEWIDK